MKIVILAAGKGTRMGDITKDTPKPLLPIGEKNILYFILESLKSIAEIEEILIVVRREHLVLFKNFINLYVSDKKITLIVQREDMKGTYAALKSVEDFLDKDKDFIVTNGDDIHTKETFSLIIKTEGVVMAAQKVPFKEGYYHVIAENGYFKDFLKPHLGDLDYISLVSGLYKMPFSFFSVTPVEIFGGEFGIPQTLVKNNHVEPIKIIEIKDSLYINTIADLEQAKIILNDLR